MRREAKSLPVHRLRPGRLSECWRSAGRAKRMTRAQCRVLSRSRTIDGGVCAFEQGPRGFVRLRMRAVERPSGQ
eukprot:11319780-Alexandrium_andersonii.AAC.1